MANERTNEAGGICWRVPNPNEAGPYYCETCGPVVLREGRGKRGKPRQHVGAAPRNMPADAVCGRCGYGLKGEVPVLEAVLVGRGEGRLWRVWCAFCEGYHHHAPHEWDRKYRRRAAWRVAHCGGNPSSPYRETGYFLRLKVACNGR